MAAASGEAKERQESAACLCGTVTAAPATGISSARRRKALMVSAGKGTYTASMFSRVKTALKNRGLAVAASGKPVMPKTFVPAVTLLKR